ncbi:ATP-binding protein [Vitiosangium sp. GDMCC 1.1324]|uniref:ATP-binding protein n=1 Tax=Vitiosangium sp. (strain GDMCC 1.1324) TaxID=2138576 RepID=UPI000D33B11B|nr:ATP-binding protein [Vitiosangium sp. GDMCC 1.1324]PTL76400.1 histidine kinase [Vitiosangium sp. GDMCC 1.1324]
MRTKRYSETALRALIESLDNPIFVAHEGRVRAANEAYLELLGLGREQVEGRHFLDFVYPGDRARFEERYRLRQQGLLKESDPRRYVLPPRPGRGPCEVASHVQEVELEDVGRAMLVNSVVLGARPAELEVAERLVETSAELVAARSEDAVRRVALAGLSAAGLSARFLARDGEHFIDRDGVPPPGHGELGLRALSEGWPVFGPALGTSTPVYLPLGTTLSEVLWVSGPGLSPSFGSVLALFAKVVGAALTDARLLADVERGRWEMVAVAEAARFVAQPEPPSPEDFLSRLASLLSAEAVLLYAPESSEGELALAAQVGLDGAHKAVLAAPLGGLSPSAVTARGVVLSSEAEERALVAATGGRLGCGAAVRLTHGGHPRGLLQVLRPPGRPFVGADLRLLGTLSELLMTLMDQRRLRTESARQLADTRLLLDLARTTTATLEVASILDVASDFLVKLLDVSNCFILLHDEQAGVLRGSAASATHRDFFRGVVIPVDEPVSIAARVARERRPIAISDLSKVAEMEDRELVRRFEEKALLGLPLTSREELIGVVLLDDTRRPRVFTSAFIELAEATCGQIALAIANARLYESLWASYAELAAARAEMVKRERLAALGELSAIVAHEVRNPLGVIFNAVASLRRMLKPDGDAGMLLDILAEESDRLNRMVGDLLDYTRPREPMLQHEDVPRVLQDAVDAARAQQGGANNRITLSAEVAPELPRVPLDRRLIRQALVNVLVNAIQAMPQGGVVQVRARVEAHGSKDVLRIDVADQGCGIPTELVHRVFEPFFTTKAQGTGLGLAVVKRIIEEHHGEMALESAPGRGTTFTFRLPLTQPTSLP